MKTNLKKILWATVLLTALVLGSIYIPLLYFEINLSYLWDIVICAVCTLIVFYVNLRIWKW
jgi:hypothetical protein